MKRFMTMILIASIVSMGMGISYAGPPQGSPQTPVQVETALAPTFTTGQVSMTGTAAIIVAAPTAGQYRYSVTIKNIGTEDVYIGSSGSVTASTGYLLATKEAITLDRSYGTIWGICVSGKLRQSPISRNPGKEDREKWQTHGASM